MNLPPFPSIPQSPEERLRWVQWGEECARMGAEAYKRGAADAERATVREPFTAKEKGIVAGDGQPCPNDHDPDCRWPDCLCRTRGAAIDAARGAGKGDGK